MTTATILIVDDEASLRESLGKILEREGFEIRLAEDGPPGLALLQSERVDLLITDLKLPNMDGMELLKAAKLLRPELEVILITGYGTIEAAVEAMRQGAYDFITKPFKKLQILKTVEKALEKVSLVAENRQLRQRLDEETSARRELVYASPEMSAVMSLVQQVAPSSATVLVQGESGTGKEMVAEVLHRLSARRDGPLVKVSCAALPETLLESELFGHERGAFTGAAMAREGRFELAHRGTLFLDEIGELPLAMQVKLLRVLQDGEFERLGGRRTLRVDVRVVTATNRDLEKEVEAKRFREDLYYRLNVIAIDLPPLRERRGEVDLLAEYFVQLYSRKNNKELSGISPDAWELLRSYHWPGNVRELENAIERAVILTRSGTIEPDHLPPAVRRAPPATSHFVIPFGTPLEEVERRILTETLRRTGGDKNLTARLLGVAARTIYRKLDRYGQPGGDEPDKPEYEEPDSASPDLPS